MEPLHAAQSDSLRTARHRGKGDEIAAHTEATGKAYTPLPKLEPPRRSRPRVWIVAAVSAAAIIAGMGVRSLLTDSQNPAPPPAPVSAVAQRDESRVLILSSSDLDHDATEQAKSALARGEVPAVLRNAPLETRQQIASGEQQLYSVRLLDFADEDGDAVSIAINGVSLGELTLANAGARLTIPLKPGAPASISITAVRDGGGGVTFRAISSRGELRTRVMAVGESETWAVVFQ